MALAIGELKNAIGISARRWMRKGMEYTSAFMTRRCVRQQSRLFSVRSPLNQNLASRPIHLFRRAIAVLCRNWRPSGVRLSSEPASSPLVPARPVAGQGEADRLPGKRPPGIYQVFIYLQLLDLLTTLLGFRLGAMEASPFIRLMMHAGPATGVIASKVLALGLGALCVYLNKIHVIRWISYWYGALVIWNLLMMLAAPAHMRG